MGVCILGLFESVFSCKVLHFCRARLRELKRSIYMGLEDDAAGKDGSVHNEIRDDKKPFRRIVLFIAFTEIQSLQWL